MRRLLASKKYVTIHTHLIDEITRAADYNKKTRTLKVGGMQYQILSGGLYSVRNVANGKTATIVAEHVYSAFNSNGGATITLSNPWGDNIALDAQGNLAFQGNRYAGAFSLHDLMYAGSSICHD